MKRFDSTILSFRPGTYDHIVSGWTYTFKLAAVNNEGKLFLFNKNKIGSKKQPMRKAQFYEFCELTYKKFSNWEILYTIFCIPNL